MAVKGRCYKKGDCGKDGRRPCLLVERIPSCNSGLAEDFKDNICITKKRARCLTFVRGVRFAKDSPQGQTTGAVLKIGGKVFEATPTGQMLKAAGVRP